MKYHSTRSAAETADAREAVLQGLCRDGGLFVSDELGSKPLRPEDIRGQSYQSIALEVFSRLLGDFTREELLAGIEHAYANTFASPAVTPVSKIGREYLLELYHGPTSAFKDVALCMLPELMSAALAGTDRRAMIVTATSGDTGKAALSGFQDVPRTGIACFFPEGKVSDIQRLQMVTQEGRNVAVAAVKGNFDDVQREVKRLFASPLRAELEEKGVTLSSANSINVGRLVPQVVYYYDAYRQLIEAREIKEGDSVDFAVPTGNFGDVLAGWYAREMGLPVRRLIVASNANCVLTDFLRTGVYDISRRPFVKTISPSMDILISSNLERLLYYVTGGDTKRVAALMKDLAERKRFVLDGEALEKVQAAFGCGFADDEATRRTIAEAWRENRRLIDPHTAVALRVARDSSADGTPCTVLATASPYKFSRDVLEAIEGRPAGDADGFACMKRLCAVTGVRPPVRLEQLEGRKILHRSTVTPAGMADFVRRAALRDF